MIQYLFSQVIRNVENLNGDASHGAPSWNPEPRWLGKRTISYSFYTFELENNSVNNLITIC